MCVCCNCRGQTLQQKKYTPFGSIRRHCFEDGTWSILTPLDIHLNISMLDSNRRIANWMLFRCIDLKILQSLGISQLAWITSQTSGRHHVPYCLHFGNDMTNILLFLLSPLPPFICFNLLFSKVVSNPGIT